MALIFALGVNKTSVDVNKRNADSKLEANPYIYNGYYNYEARYMFKPMQKSWLSPFLLITYLATSITGILMLFHIKFTGLYPVHEWVGLAFVIAGILHVVLNWKLLTSYFCKSNLKLNATYGTIIGLILIIIVAFTIPSKGHGDHSRYHANTDSVSQAVNSSENS